MVKPYTDVGVVPVVTEVDGYENIVKKQSLSLTQGQAANITWIVRDPSTGEIVDLTGVPSIVARVREAINSGNTTASEQITAVVTDAEAGEITIQLTSALVDYPGVSICEVAVRDGSNNVLFTNKFWIIVNRGQFGADVTTGGPPTLEDIRLHLRDSSPVDNLLLDELEFDNGEIAHSIIRPIEHFNNAQPQVRTTYNTSNFPWRFYWLEGIVYNLFMIAATHYRRNHLAYQAAGISVDDMNKEREYLQAALMHGRTWDEFVKAKKVQLNIESGWGSVLSPYSSAYRGVRFDD